MIANNLWSALRTRLRPAADTPQYITVQNVMPSGVDLIAVQAALDRVGEALAVQFELQEHIGDIVLMDADLALRMSPQAVQAFVEERPLVTLTDLRRADDLLLSGAQRFERRQRELLVQLREIPLVRRRATPGASSNAPALTQGKASQAFDSSFDSHLDGSELAAVEVTAAQRDLVHRVLHGLRTPGTPPLTAGYGANAHLRFDFQARTVHIDALALQHLRVRRELPHAAPGATPGPEAQVRELDETVWDLGLAFGPCALLDAPADWWHTPLQWVRGAHIEPHTRVPRYIELARRLQCATLTPSELRRRARVSVSDLRRFLQATLMLGLLHWQPDSPHPA